MQEHALPVVQARGDGVGEERMVEPHAAVPRQWVERDETRGLCLAEGLEDVSGRDHLLEHGHGGLGREGGATEHEPGGRGQPHEP